MTHEESEIQRACVAWFRYSFPEYSGLFFSVPNGGRRMKREAKILKAEGTLAGVCDLILLLPRHGKHGLCIEMKTANGRQQSTQKEFQQAVESRGYLYAICRSQKDFMQLISSYLRNE